jgi:hypothetical protein
MLENRSFCECMRRPGSVRNRRRGGARSSVRSRRCRLHELEPEREAARELSARREALTCVGSSAAIVRERMN